MAVSTGPTGGLVAVHAHPDDETLTMGGTLARYAAAGVPVTLVTATLGELGEVMDPTLTGLTADHADLLGGLRYRELGDACAALGIADHRLLGGVGRFRDSGMLGAAGAGHPRAFVRAGTGGPDHEEAVESLAEVLRELRPKAVLGYAADGGYGHPDHVTAHQVMLAAAAQAGVPRCVAVVKPRADAQAALDRMPPPPAGYRRAEPPDLGFFVDRAEIGISLDPDSRHRRQQALAAHATQLDLIPGGFALTNRAAQPLGEREYFTVLAGPSVPIGTADLLAGL